MITTSPAVVVAQAEIEALRRLVADCLGAPMSDRVPFAVVLPLFDRLDERLRDELFRVEEGRILVQEHLAVQVNRRPRAGEVFGLRTDAVVDAATRLAVDLLADTGEAIATVRTSMRPVAAADLAAAVGLPIARATGAMSGPAPERRTTRPLTHDLVERWVRLVGDENPVHVDAPFAATLGLAGPLVPGALIAALLEDLVDAVEASAFRVAMRFAAPILVGRALEVEIRERGRDPETGRRDLRLLCVDGDRVAALADVTLRPGSP